jgi:selenide,water dikinase
LVGLGSPDDAAVWRLSDDKALVITTDFFTPVVDDGYDYGAIAAANSLSDIYAMGGKPFLALNVAALPEDLNPDVAADIVRGGAEKALEAGVVIAGGHTIKDEEPKFGLVALGFIDPNKMMRKSGLRVGDKMVLTKPLGFGVTTTALKQDKIEESIDVKEVVEWMTRLNASASELALGFDVRGGTDITGFGLLGHAVEMSQASKVKIRFEFEKIPFTGGARKYAEMGCFAGGAYDNKAFFRRHMKILPSIPETSRMLMFDPQTSGGLLLGVAAERLDEFLINAKEMKQPVWVIGEVQAGKGVEVVE